MKNGHVLTFALLAILACFSAPTPGVAATTDEATVLRKIHLINQTEINAGKLALERANMPSTKEFANVLIKDHSAADRKVMDLARRQGVNLNDLSADEVKKTRAEGDELLKELRAEKPSDFDRIFGKRMESAHNKAIAELERSRAALAGTPTAELIAGLLPSLRHHEHRAAGIERLAE